MSGRVFEYEFPPNFQPWAVAVGPGRTLWISSLSLSEILILSRP